MIAHSTDSDLAYIKVWLEVAHAKFGEGSWINWPHIERAHQDRRLLLLREDEQAIAFHTRGETLCGSSILEVHPERRREGLGRLLTKHLVQKARDSGQILIDVQCVTEASRHLMQSLDFQVAKGLSGVDSEIHYLPLEKKLPLPEGGQAVTVTVQFFEENSSRLICEHQVEGRQQSDGSVALAKRIIGYSMPLSPDIEVTVSVDGRALFPKGRAKNLGSFGLIAKDGAIYLDRVLPGGG
jgi:GNAT superfamily N-acetyltransferase